MATSEATRNADVVLETAADRPLANSTEVDQPSSHVLHIPADKPLHLECQRELGPFQIA